jgi:hypothetical protein
VLSLGRSSLSHCRGLCSDAPLLDMVRRDHPGLAHRSVPPGLGRRSVLCGPGRRFGPHHRVDPSRLVVLTVLDLPAARIGLSVLSGPEGLLVLALLLALGSRCIRQSVAPARMHQ